MVVFQVAAETYRGPRLDDARRQHARVHGTSVSEPPRERVSGDRPRHATVLLRVSVCLPHDRGG